MLGTPFMPWQQEVADVALELVENEMGLWVPAYREVIVTVMRQCGKSTIVLAVLVDRALSWDEPQRMVYTAQTAQEARRKLLEDWEPILTAKRNPLAGAIKNIRRQSGSEGVRWKSGSSLAIIPRDGSAGHGRTLDVGVIDEAFDDEDDRGEQAISPAMVTRPQAQKWILSTMGTDASAFLNGKVEVGRHAAAQGKTDETAYFEWSIPKDEDIDDPEVWAAYNPAFGFTISESVLRHERTTMKDAEFRRAYGNQRTDAKDDGPFPAELWRAVCDDHARPTGELRYGLDVMDDRSHGAIAVVGDAVGELLESREGVSWIVERMVEIVEHHRGTVVIDGGGPAAYIADELERRKITVERLGTPEIAAACARIYDAVADRAIKVRTSGPMTEAVGAVRKRPVGDRFAWSRSASSGDITPFFALTLAFRPAERQAVARVINLADIPDEEA